MPIAVEAAPVAAKGKQVIACKITIATRKRTTLLQESVFTQL